jgi:hypothetical protein
LIGSIGLLGSKGLIWLIGLIGFIGSIGLIGFKAKELRVLSLRFSVQGSGFRVYGLGFTVHGSGFRPNWRDQCKMLVCIIVSCVRKPTSIIIHISKPLVRRGRGEESARPI